VRDARLLTAETEMELMQRELAECKAQCRRLETHVAAADALTATLQQEQVRTCMLDAAHEALSLAPLTRPPAPPVLCDVVVV